MIIINKMIDQTRPLSSGIAKQLLVHDTYVNGLKAIIYCYGLSASRYIEYASTLAFLLPEVRKGDTILEVGCGHSILPIFWQRMNLEIIALDSNLGALKWQMKKSRKTTSAFFHVVLADMKHIPFKNESIFGVSCISAIEHIPGDGDAEAAFEIGRILKNNGIGIISMPLSLQEKSYSKTGWTVGIPLALQSFFKFCLPKILSRLSVDRTGFYFERLFSFRDVRKRIIESSGCLKEDYLTLKSGNVTKFIHQKIIPTGVLTPLECLLAKFLITSKRTRNMDAIILKLRKRDLKKRYL